MKPATFTIASSVFPASMVLLLVITNCPLGPVVYDTTVQLLTVGTVLLAIPYWLGKPMVTSRLPAGMTPFVPGSAVLAFST
ncbi:hypothetical protein D9M68_595330 [compost metagenome]